MGGEFYIQQPPGGSPCLLGRGSASHHCHIDLSLPYRQDANLRLDEAIVTTTPSPPFSLIPFHTEMKKRDGHGHPTPQCNPALFHKKHKLSCPRKQWIGNGGFHFPSQSKQAPTTFTSFHNGRGIVVAMVTSTILPQKRQDAHLHLHEAIVHNDMGNGLPWSHQPFFPR